MNYWCLWRNFFMCEMTHLYATWFIHECHDCFTCDTTHSSVTCLIHVWYDSSTCDMTHSNATWLIVLVEWQPYSKPITVAQAQKKIRSSTVWILTPFILVYLFSLDTGDRCKGCEGPWKRHAYQLMCMLHVIKRALCAIQRALYCLCRLNATCIPSHLRFISSWIKWPALPIKKAWHCIKRSLLPIKRGLYVLIRAPYAVRWALLKRALRDSAVVCYSVLQCVAVCCSVVQCAAMCCSVVQCVAVWCNVLHCVAVCCSVLQCVAVCCSVL